MGSPRSPGICPATAGRISRSTATTGAACATTSPAWWRRWSCATSCSPAIRAAAASRYSPPRRWAIAATPPWSTSRRCRYNREPMAGRRPCPSRRAWRRWRRRRCAAASRSPAARRSPRTTAPRTPSRAGATTTSRRSSATACRSTKTARPDPACRPEPWRDCLRRRSASMRGAISPRRRCRCWPSMATAAAGRVAAATRWPRCALRVMQNATHTGPMERPEEFERLLREVAAAS